MNDSLFVTLDRLLLEFVFQYEQDINAKEEMVQRINTCFESIKENKASICKIRETIDKTDEEITHYYKHSKEIKDSCSNWKQTCDVFHKHEDYIQNQFTVYEETVETDKKMYHGYVCQYKDVLKQYQLKYSETHFSHKYYEKKREHEEIQNRVLASAQQLKQNENILMQLLVPVHFPSLIKWTLHIVNLRCKTQDILKHAKNVVKSSFELKQEADEMEIEIDSLQKIASLYENKKTSETLEERNKNIEKHKELKERVFEKGEDVHELNKTHRSIQLFLPYKPQKFIRPIKMNSSEPKVIDKKEESFFNQLKLANIDFGQKENDTQVLNDSNTTNNSKTQVTALKSSQIMQFRLKQPCYSQWVEKGHTDAECGDTGTVGQPRESKCTPQAIYMEHFGKSVESNSDDERAESLPDMPMFLKSTEAVKTPEPFAKILLPKSPCFEMNAVPESQKDSPGFSFLMSYPSRSPGLNLFESSIFDSEMSSDQHNEHYSTRSLNPPSSQEIGNLFGKSDGEDAFTFAFPSDTSTHTFGSGKDDFTFPFAFEQDQNTVSSSSLKDYPSSSQSKTQFTFL